MGIRAPACSKVYAQRIIKRELVEKLVKKVKGLRLGIPFQVSPFVGPLIKIDAI